MKFPRFWPLITRAVGVLAIVVVSLLLIHRDRNASLFPAADEDPGVSVWVIENGFHSDLVLPAATLRGRTGAMAQALKDMPQTPFVTVGWGDARFYVATIPVAQRPIDGMRALFAPNNPTLLRLEPLSRPPAFVYDETVLQLRLSPAGFERLARRLDQSFALGADLGPDLARPWPTRAFDARYFHSREHFSILHVCNHWTGELLSAAGLPTRPALDTVSGGLVWDLMQEDGARRIR